jgi:hypothetical protein
MKYMIVIAMLVAAVFVTGCSTVTVDKKLRQEVLLEGAF